MEKAHLSEPDIQHCSFYWVVNMRQDVGLLCSSGFLNAFYTEKQNRKQLIFHYICAEVASIMAEQCVYVTFLFLEAHTSASAYTTNVSCVIFTHLIVLFFHIN